MSLQAKGAESPIYVKQETKDLLSQTAKESGMKVWQLVDSLYKNALETGFIEILKES